VLGLAMVALWVLWVVRSVIRSLPKEANGDDSDAPGF
jgi:hypothetical protein